MLACCAQVWAAVKIAFSHLDVVHLLLKVLNRLLLVPPEFMTVPSGTKLMVTTCGCGQALLPEARTVMELWVPVTLLVDVSVTVNDSVPVVASVALKTCTPASAVLNV